MRKINKLIILLLFFTSISSFSCKRKYEEGPLISLSSKCKRLTQGWRLEYFYIDGVDSTDAIYKSWGILDNKFYAIFSEGGSDRSCYDNGEIRIDIHSTTNNSHLTGSYFLTKGGEYLNMNIIDTKTTLNLKYTPVGPFFSGDIVAYRIKRLTKKELWLDITYGGKYIWIHFKSVNK